MKQTRKNRALLTLPLVDNNMTSKEFNKKHHENHDWHTSFDIAIGVVFFLVSVFLLVSLNYLKTEYNLNKLIVIFIFLSLVYIYSLLYKYFIRSFFFKYQSKHQLFCPECKFNFASITPNYDKSTILVENKCPNCSSIVVNEL